MGFESLLGNERLKDNLRQSLKNNRISHFYLISGAEGSGKHTLAALLAAAVLCKGSDRPCCRCNSCRKVLENSHPDFITVDDPEKKTVSIDLVRQACADVYVLPNESDRKVYLFPRAQDMRTEAQNALLKVLEEPPAYGVFLLLTDNPEKLLPTVRSRCVELKLLPLEENTLLQELKRRFPDAQPDTLRSAAQRSGGFLGQAIQLLTDGEEDPQTAQFAQSFSNRDALGLLHTLVSMEKFKRDVLIDTLERWSALLTEALQSRSGLPAVNPLARTIGASRSARDIMAAVQTIRKCIEYAQGNISVAAICGYLTWELR